MAETEFERRTVAKDAEPTPEQILADALALYAALPEQVRASTIEALRSSDPAAHASLIRQIVRAIAGWHLERRRLGVVRESMREDEAEVVHVDLDEDRRLGEEAVRMVRESREYRAGLRQELLAALASHDRSDATDDAVPE